MPMMYVNRRRQQTMNAERQSVGRGELGSADDAAEVAERGYRNPCRTEVVVPNEIHAICSRNYGIQLFVGGCMLAEMQERADEGHPPRWRI